MSDATAAPDSRQRSLAIPSADDLVFGTAPAPVQCGFDLTIGGGQVYPEVNFTLPTMLVDSDTWPRVIEQYDEIARGVIGRAVALKVPGIVLEFELLPAMTEAPEFGAEVTVLLKRHLVEAHERSGLRSALRVTPTDIRDKGKQTSLRSGEPWERLRASFERCVESGADIISIESIGGKEVHDEALVYGDLFGIVFALGVLAPRDTGWLWDQITGICGERAVPGGDTACGFANTAMQLAHQKMLPEVLAAVVRAMAAVRSLAAFEHGAIGPSKDCAYEGPVIKAITGCPISMEGKSASCAHFSPVGNIAAAMCDLWSNESVQNVRLLSGSAPEAYTEALAYDCRLMNVAAGRGEARRLRDWLVSSDEWLSPQAAVLSPAATIEIANAIVAAEGNYRRTLAAGKAAVGILRSGLADGRLALGKRELEWLDRIESELDELPATEDEIVAEGRKRFSEACDFSSYGLE